jgi:hypothetical protein
VGLETLLRLNGTFSTAACRYEGRSRREPHTLTMQRSVGRVQEPKAAEPTVVWAEYGGRSLEY